jgi:L-aminopeptidase/D-esterase-like protein
MSEGDTVPAVTIDDVRVGHWTDPVGRTGCTVVLLPGSLPTVVDSRGGAPGTRETDVLGHANLVRRADAILLTGGSAMGLAAADGVVAALRARGRGFPTAAGPVPIVPAAVLFDLTTGSAVWPGPEHGRAALEAAVPVVEAQRGRVGAGTGATSGKVTGTARPGGVGIASVPCAAGSVTVVAAVNAFGAGGADAARGALLAGRGRPPLARVGENTTIAAVVVDAAVDAVTLHRCAIAAHDGMARAIVPCHTLFDGDTVFVSGTRTGTPGPGETLALSVAAELAMERAVRSAVRVAP